LIFSGAEAVKNGRCKTIAAENKMHFTEWCTGNPEVLVQS